MAPILFIFIDSLEKKGQNMIIDLPLNERSSAVQAVKCVGALPLRHQINIPCNSEAVMEAIFD